MSRDIRITPHLGSTATGLYPEIKFRGISQSFITLKVDDDGSVVYTGTYGALFNITDNKDGLLHSVNDISGLPILSVYSYDFVQMGKWDKYTLVVNSDKVGIGLTGPSSSLHIYSTQSGAFRLEDTTQAAGYVLVSDAYGVGTWTSSGGFGGTNSSGVVQLANGSANVATTLINNSSKVFLTYAGNDIGTYSSFSPLTTWPTLFAASFVTGSQFTVNSWDATTGTNIIGDNNWVNWLIIN